MNPKTLVISVLMLAVLVSCGCTSNQYLDLKFYVDESDETISGDVYLNGVFLGSTKNGILSLSRSNMTTGSLDFLGEYNGREFNFSYDIYEEDLEEKYLEFTVSSQDLNSYTLYFYVNESGENLDGNVYLNNKYLGMTVKGELVVNIDQLFPGTIILNGTYEDKDFEFQFNFPKEDLGYFYRDFVISQEEIGDIIFDVSNLDINKMENYIFDLVNEERARDMIKQLKWNEELSTLAREYSKEMITGGFHHTDIEGKSLGDRLKDNNIFYISAGENLYSTGYLSAGTDEYEIGKMAVEGWLKSPGHRSLVLDRDELYSDAGVGVFCEEKYCYVTMDLVSLEVSMNMTMGSGFCWFYQIYDPSYVFGFDVPVKIQIDATEKIRAYIVDDESKFDDCVYGREIDYIKNYFYVKNIDDEILAKKGYGLLFKSNLETDMSILIVYHPESRSYMPEEGTTIRMPIIIETIS